jgi:hypothetical protein
VIFDLPADRRSAGTARRIVAVTLDAWALAGLRADAQLVVSEMVSNALMHAPGAAGHELQILRRTTGIRLVVADGSSSPPVLRPADGGPGGRGLRIIEALAAAWGCELRADGKQVWADLDEPDHG